MISGGKWRIMRQTTPLAQMQTVLSSVAFMDAGRVNNDRIDRYRPGGV
jgi:hypothetical protein